jgi:Phage portal protein
MAFWNRKADDKPVVDQEQLAKVIAEEIQKAMNPYAAAGGSVVSSMPGFQSGYAGGGGQNLLQTPGTPAMPLPRPADAFGSQLGPAMPYLPAPLDPVFDDTGRALPRKYQYEVAWNLNLDENQAPWAVLKALSEQCDIIHRCIEVRSAEIAGKALSFTVSDQAIAKIMQEQNVGHAKANQIAREQYGEAIDDSLQFWENPYVHGDRTWSEWITEVCWQHFVFDGIPIYPRYNLGKEVIGFEIIDASTIKALLDNRGDIPHPPAPAFQQVLWGFPRGEYQASPNNDGEFFINAGQNDEYIRDQLAYFVKNRRTWSPYGYSPVEQAIPMASIYLDRQNWLKQEYAAGTMPSTFMKTDSDELDHLKLAALERVMNDQLAGSNAERHRVKMLPKSFDPVFAPTIDERYKSEYDEFIIKRVAACFGVQPTQLGIIPRTGLGGRGQQEGERDQAELMNKQPTEQFFLDMVNSLNHRFRGIDRSVTAVFEDQDTAENEQKKAQSLQVSLYSGQKTLNDVRSENGEPLYDMPEADEPFIVAGNAITFLKGLLETDESGETVGQTAEAPAQAGDASEPQEPIKLPPTPQANLTEPAKQDEKPQEVETEMKAFRSFVAKRKQAGKWRDFVFDHVDADVAKVLNEQAKETVLKKKPIQAGKQVTYQEQLG